MRNKVICTTNDDLRYTGITGASVLPLSPGIRLGSYEILALLGTGGMGEVYRAKDVRLSREVALKVLSIERVPSAESRQRFLQEAQAASQLNHPNIVIIYDIGSQDDLDYIAMEYVRGKTLDNVIPRGGFRLSPMLRYAIPIADGLSRAHAANVVHRDLKPANIMIGDDGQVKLLDFGLAKWTALQEAGSVSDSPTLTAEGTIVGTVSYMSPEQAQGKTVDARSDIWSYGAILYEMLTGERAFHTENAISTLTAILRDEPKPVGAVPEDARGELERIIARCLRKDRDRRWQTMADVKVALEELKDESTSTRLTASVRLPPAEAPVAIPAPPAPKAKSNSNAVLAGIAFILLAVLIGGGYYGVRKLQELRQQVTPPVAETTPPANPAPVPATPAPAPGLTNDQVIEMVRSGLSSAIVISHIKEEKTNFDLSTAELIRLAKERVPNDVIEVMKNPQAPVPAPKTAPAVARTTSPADKNQPGTPAVVIPLPTPVQTPAVSAVTLAPPPPVHKAVPVETQVQTLGLKDGDRIKISLTEDIAIDPEDGKPIHLVVGDDVKANGETVIPSGSTVNAAIEVMEGKKLLLFKGVRTTLKLQSVKTIDGQSIPLRVRANPGEGDKQIRLSAPNQDMKSRGILVAKGTEYYAYLDKDAKVQVTSIKK
jgi:serine/threonine protein kinase